MKSNVRGMLSTLATFHSALGTTLFAVIGGYAFEKIAPSAPFTVLATADSLIIIASLIFIFGGYISRDD